MDDAPQLPDESVRFLAWIENEGESATQGAAEMLGCPVTPLLRTRIVDLCLMEETKEGAVLWRALVWRHPLVLSLN